MSSMMREQRASPDSRIDFSDARAARRRACGRRQQLEHAEHAVHGRADLVAHGREERALRAVGLDGGFLGVGERALGALALGDVGVEAHEAAVGERRPADVQHGAVGSRPLLVMRARLLRRLQHARRYRLGIDGPVFPSIHVEPHQRLEGHRPRSEAFAGQVEQPPEPFVAHRHLHAPVHERGAIGHHLENRLERAELGPELALGFLAIGDVDERAEQAAQPPVSKVEGVHPGQDVVDRPIGVPHPQLRELRAAGFQRPELLGVHGLTLRARRVGEEIEQGLAAQLATPHPKHLLVGAVAGEVPAFGVLDEERARHGVEERRLERELVGQRRFRRAPPGRPGAGGAGSRSRSRGSPGPRWRPRGMSTPR